MTDFSEIKLKIFEEISKADNLKLLERIYIDYLGRKGIISNFFGEIKNLSGLERAEFGKNLNELKKYAENELEKKKSEIKNKTYKETLKREKIDITRPGRKIIAGHLHPLTIVRNKVEEIFTSMGFGVAEGPHIESEYYNFDALNIPSNHPARDMWDTFWIKPVKIGYLLRTHTSPVQIRYMEKNNPPIRIIAPGRTFRYEATDASHDIDFLQVEGLMIDKNISVANFKFIIEEFFSIFYGKKIKSRLRPSYFPFVEPGFEVDISCVNCGGKGCSSCGHSGWLEIMGAGMVHPNVLKAGGLNPSDWQGFAFGIGLDRITMMKYKINDIRLFRSGDLRFLKQF